MRKLPKIDQKALLCAIDAFLSKQSWREA